MMLKTLHWVGLGIEGFIEKQKYFIGSNKYLRK